MDLEKAAEDVVNYWLQLDYGNDLTAFEDRLGTKASMLKRVKNAFPKLRFSSNQPDLHSIVIAVEEYLFN